MERKMKPETRRTLAGPEALINEFLEASLNGISVDALKITLHKGMGAFLINQIGNAFKLEHVGSGVNIVRHSLPWRR